MFYKKRKMKMKVKEIVKKTERSRPRSIEVKIIYWGDASSFIIGVCVYLVHTFEE